MWIKVGATCCVGFADQNRNVGFSGSTKLPKNLQPKAKENLHKIWMAEKRKDAEQAFDSFVNIYEAKYPNAVNCLTKDRDVLLSFYDFPVEHWWHIRTTNPIESTFATVKLRTAKVRGCFSSRSVLSMAFKLCRFAKKNWMRLHHYEKFYCRHFFRKTAENLRFTMSGNGIV